MIKVLSVQYKVTELCQALGGARSSYYAWLGRKPSKRAQDDQALIEEIRSAHREGRSTYGSPRITRALRRKGRGCGKNRVARLMRENKIRGVSKRRFRPRTTEADHRRQPAPNLLKDREQPSKPNQVWVADITYLRARQGWIYLAAVMDLCTRTICGWALGPSPSTDLVTKALKSAVWRYRPSSGLLHHSDRGCQYTSSDYQSLLAFFGFEQSMSARGHCYDNAAMESFWSTLKAECVGSTVYNSIFDARVALFDYIEAFYNRSRLHSGLGFKSPVDFEAESSTL